MSASLSRAEAMSAWLLKTIGDVPWLRHMLPDSHDGRYSRIAFDVGTCKYIEQSPSVRAAGVTGQVTGACMLNRTYRRLRDTYDCAHPDPAREAPQRPERDGGDPQAR